jgi:hypothetical protein
MNLSIETIGVLKNFAAINSNIAFNTDSVLRTVAVSKNIMAKSAITESFPYDFGIYDLTEFLGAINMFEDPDLAFDESKKFVSITDGTSSLKYFFSDISNLVIAKNEPKMPDVAVSFTLNDVQMNTLRKASGALKAANLVATPNGSGQIDLTVTDVKNPTSNEFKLTVDAVINNDTDFNFVLNIGNFKFSTSDEYVFDISTKRIASVTAESTQYWLALEKSSN